MRIFRQYATETSFDATTEAFRTYYMKMDYATGTSVSLNSDWIPMAGKLKSDMPGITATQTSADSLTWENGKTVRFRAWGRSNLANAINSGTKGNYYPDYTISDWVTVSGPTKSIPLTMRHIACRIGLTCKAGNEFGSATICTDWEDYKRKDNADTQEHDNAETTKSDEDAQAELEQVMKVYNKMCMPAGVDDKTFLLTAMPQTLYNDVLTDFKNMEKYGVFFFLFKTRILFINAPYSCLLILGSKSESAMSIIVDKSIINTARINTTPWTVGKSRPITEL